MFNEFLSQNILWVGAFVVVFNLWVFSLLQGRVAGAKSISPLELPQIQRDSKTTIIDIRDPKDYNEQHLPGSINIPLPEINADNAKLLKHKDKSVIVTCHAGHQSGKAAKQLVTLGFDKIFMLNGGLLAWVKANMPTESTK